MLPWVPEVPSLQGLKGAEGANEREAEGKIKPLTVKHWIERTSGTQGNKMLTNTLIK
jgi:hypothetical protein